MFVTSESCVPGSFAPNAPAASGAMPPVPSEAARPPHALGCVRSCRNAPARLATPEPRPPSSWMKLAGSDQNEWLGSSDDVGVGATTGWVGPSGTRPPYDFANVLAKEGAMLL